MEFLKLTLEDLSRVRKEIQDSKGEKITCLGCGAPRASRIHAYDPHAFSFFCINGCGRYINLDPKDIDLPQFSRRV
jgi:hypothetical protein